MILLHAILLLSSIVLTFSYTGVIHDVGLGILSGTVVSLLLYIAQTNIEQQNIRRKELRSNILIRHIWRGLPSAFPALAIHLIFTSTKKKEISFRNSEFEHLFYNAILNQKNEHIVEESLRQFDKNTIRPYCIDVMDALTERLEYFLLLGIYDKQKLILINNLLISVSRFSLMMNEFLFELEKGTFKSDTNLQLGKQFMEIGRLIYHLNKKAPVRCIPAIE